MLFATAFKTSFPRFKTSFPRFKTSFPRRREPKFACAVVTVNGNLNAWDLGSRL